MIITYFKEGNIPVLIAVGLPTRVLAPDAATHWYDQYSQ